MALAVYPFQGSWGYSGESGLPQTLITENDNTYYRFVRGPKAEELTIRFEDFSEADYNTAQAFFDARQAAALAAPTTAPTATDSGTVGNVNIGSHSWNVTFFNATGETAPGPASNIITIAATAKQVNLSAIPLGPPGTTGRKIYRTVAGNTGSYLLVGTINDNTTTTFVDNIADLGLGAAAPASNSTTADFSFFIYDPRVVKSVDTSGVSTVGRRTAIFLDEKFPWANQDFDSYSFNLKVRLIA